ncbi:DUF3450 domain-containing protein [Agarivorans sp.]|uniref:DUF3450 domain-containing protein n=1 Tax=Agarivorans sp. TaxID=1872412 RepID=UPI003D011868
MRCLIFIFAALLMAHAQASVDVDNQLRIQQLNSASQQRIDDIEQQRQVFAEQSQALLQQAQLLEQYNLHLSAMIAQQNQQLSQLDQDLSELQHSQQLALPMVHQLLSRLQSFVSSDLPFLMQERQQRLNRLTNLLDRADVSLAEKYRQVLEAFQIEMEYGDTIEAYSGALGEQQVNYFRLGRTALYYQSLNGQSSALWQAEQQRWQALDDAANRELGQAIAIAWQQQPPALLQLPLPAVKEASDE